MFDFALEGNSEEDSGGNTKVYIESTTVRL
jgi:hypothetical protein